MKTSIAVTIATIITAIVVGGVVYAAMLRYVTAPAAPSTVTSTVTKTVAAGAGATITSTITKAVTSTITKTVTGAAGAPKVITVKIWTIGPEPTSFYRLKNFQIVASELNNMFKLLGANVEIKIDGQYFVRPVEWGTYKNKFFLAMKAGKGPDIFLDGHEDIGYLVENNYIIPLDKYIKEYWNTTFYDVIPVLWKAVKYKGHIWGVPQDTEVRPLYFRKDVLRKLGWSDQQINNFPKLIEEGKITLWDILKIAKQAVDKGLVKRGLVHRVKEGWDYFQFYLGFGGKLWDSKTDKMVVCKDAWLKTFEWLHAAVWQYHVILPTQFSGDWDKDFHTPFTKGYALFCSGGSWHEGEWIHTGRLTEQQFKEDVGFALHPAGEPGLKPVTLSHPLIYTITTQAEKDGVADVAGLLLALVTNPHLNALHAVYSGHLAILNSELSDSRYAQNWFLHDVAYMLKYTTFVPDDPHWGDYSRIVYNTLKAVESTQSLTPEQALNMMLSEMKKDIGSYIEIVNCTTSG